MPSSVGPNISADNSLVFNYDTGDTTNSYLGEPTKNELVQITWWGDGVDQSGFAKSTTLVTDSSLKYNNYETYLWAPGASRNVYLNSADISTTVSSSVWTFSCYVKREDGLPIPSMNVYMYYPNSDGTGPALVQDVGNGWYRLSRTRVSASYQSYIALAGFTGFAVNTKYYLSGPQLEMQDHATQFVYPTQTRSVSGSLLDISGYNRTINCTNGGYNSQAKLSFNGSSNVLDIGSLGTIGDQYSIECVFNSSNIVNYRNVYDMNYSTYNPNTGNVGPRLEQVSNPGIRWIWSGNTTNNGLYNFTSIVPILPNKYYHSVFTLSSGIVNGYFNGVLTNSNTTSAQGYITSFQDVKVGRGFVLDPSRFFSGSIDIFKVYNRVLSVDEVVNNFNELKTRFNFS